MGNDRESKPQIATKEPFVKPEIAAVIAFLKKYRMDYTDIDVEAAIDSFLKEMNRGLAGPGGSLAMIPTYIDIPRDIPLDQPVIVLDAGGTNFRVAVVTFNAAKQPVISAQKRFSMPGIGKETAKADFFGAIASYLDDARDASDRIGFCFSYPTEILPNRDGRVLHFSKEIKAREVEGELVGESLLEALRARGFRGGKHIVLLNDTVTTLLAGTSLLLDRRYGGFIGFILGTGTHIAYLEKNALIKKTGGLDAGGSQIINIETGDFNLAPAGVLDRRLDQGTKNPGRYAYEKMFSGAYFGPLCGVVLAAAAADGLFGPDTAAALGARGDLDTKTVSDFMVSPFRDNALAEAVKTGHDRTTLYVLLDRMIERSALLASVALAAAVLKGGGGDDPCRPVCVSAEGSTFFGLKGLRFRTEYYLKQYLTERRQRHAEIVSIPDATLVGAAIAGLTN
jgi:hexokinase